MSNSNRFMKKEKTDRISKQLYATTTFLNKGVDDPYSFFQMDKERR